MLSSLSPSSSSSRSTELMQLPTEIHLLIAIHLPYPDALSLKHASRHFFYLIDSGIRLKVAWLLERRRLRLECPNACELKTDETFCSSSHVRRLMVQRRRHLECGRGKGCLVLGDSARTCSPTWNVLRVYHALYSVKRLSRLVEDVWSSLHIDRRRRVDMASVIRWIWTWVTGMTVLALGVLTWWIRVGER